MPMHKWFSIQISGHMNEFTSPEEITNAIRDTLDRLAENFKLETQFKMTEEKNTVERSNERTA